MEKEEILTDNKQINLYNKINLFFALFFACIPIINFIFNRFFICSIYALFMNWSLFYNIFIIIFCVLIFKKIINQIKKNRLLKLIYIFLISFLTLVFLSNIINNSLNKNFYTFFGFIMIFICIATLEKEYIKFFFNTTLVSIMFSFLLSIIDPCQSWILYLNNGFPMSSFFSNPNYASYVACMFIIILSNLIMMKKDVIEKIIYSICFTILSVYIYMNGSFASITIIYLALLIELIILWIKNKKCPLSILIVILSFIAICLLLELIPNFHDVCTCEYNYFIECVAVFDNIFHTNLLQSIFNIPMVHGSDGWSRTSLIKEAVYHAIGGDESTFFGKLKVVIFGSGAGATQEYRPHNMFISIWLEYGIVASISDVYIPLSEFLFVGLLPTLLTSASNILESSA